MTATGRRGLTIIEVLIAVAIIGVLFVVFASFQISSLQITSVSQADSRLLERGVTSFEFHRSQVLQDFQGRYQEFRDFVDACEPDEVCQYLVDLTGGGREDAVLKGTDYPGLLEVEIIVSDGSRSLTFAQYVSCLDANEAPTLERPDVCGVEVP